ALHPRLGGCFAPADLLLTGEAGTQRTFKRDRERGTHGRTGPPRVRDGGKGEAGFGGRARARRVDAAARAAGVSDVDGAFLAGAAWSLLAADRAQSKFSEEGIKTRKGHAAGHSRRGGSKIPRSDVDGWPHDRTDQARVSVAAPSEEKNQPPHR